jgi:predicted small lipoprotein YifL
MKKTISALLILFLVILGLTGCGGASNNETPENTTPPAETPETAVPGADQPATEASPSDTFGPKLSGAFVDLMKSGKYLMKYKTTMDFEGKITEADLTFAVDGDKTATYIKGEGFESNMILRDDRIYMVDHAQKMIIEMAAPEDPDAEVEKIDTTGITFVDSGIEDGLEYEEYSITNGTIRYYFDNKELVRIKSTSEGVTSIMEIEELSDKVTDDMFEIPLGYQKFMM